MSRWISIVRPSGRPRDAARWVHSPVDAGRSEYSAVIQPRPLAAEPPRDLLLHGRGAEHDRAVPARRGSSRAAARGSRAGGRARGAGRGGGRRGGSCGPPGGWVVVREVTACPRGPVPVARSGGGPDGAERHALDVGGSGAGGSACPSRANAARVARRQEAVAWPSRSFGVLDPLAGERLGDLARRLLRGEDEGDAPAEDPLEDRPQDRVMGAAEDDRVDALPREAVRRPRARPRSSPPRRGRGPSISGTRRGGATATTSTPASWASYELLVAAARDGGLGRARRPTRRSRWGRAGCIGPTWCEDADDGHRERALQVGKPGRGGGVAGDDDKLTPSPSRGGGRPPARSDAPPRAGAGRTGAARGRRGRRRPRAGA